MVLDGNQSTLAVVLKLRWLAISCQHPSEFHALLMPRYTGLFPRVRLWTIRVTCTNPLVALKDGLVEAMCGGLFNTIVAACC